MSWPVVPLAKALDSAQVFVDGDWVESKDQDPDGDVRLIQLADIGDGYYVDKSNRFLTADAARRLKCTFLEAGDLLIARMPDPLGRACIFPGDSKRAVTVVDVCIIRPDSNAVYTPWLMHCVNSPQSRNQIDEYTTGTTRQRISRGNLAKIKVALPSLEEQRRIAAILDQAETLRTQRRQALAHLDTLTQSLFLDMFGDPVTNPKGWPLGTLKSLGKVSTGGTPPSNLQGMFDGAIPFLTPGDLESDSAVKRTVTDAGAAEAVTVRAGATLVCCIGATIGKTDIARQRSAFNQQLNAVDWTSLINDCYGLMALRALKPIIVSRGASTTMPILKKSSFEQLSICVPPLALQQTFATRIQAIEALKATHRTALAQLDALFASLQQRAFAGQL